MTTYAWVATSGNFATTVPCLSVLGYFLVTIVEDLFVTLFSGDESAAQCPAQG